MQMMLGKISAIAVGVALTLCVATAVSAQTSKPAEKRNASTSKLTISKDGRAIVDQNGKVVARFAKGIKVQAVTKGDKNPPGCLRCYDVCVIYDRNGNCVSWSRTCDWDWDC